MDSVTQMLLGATVGQAGFRSSLGRRAPLAGALIALIPDLDVIGGWVAGPMASWLYHRGITHSLFFAPILGPLLGWLIWRLCRARDRNSPTGRQEALRSWIWLTILALITHPVIDLFTSYGTQLLAPFSNHRFAIDALPIIDPVYSLILILALIAGSILRHKPRLAQDCAAMALIGISLYTLWGWSINESVKQEARNQLNQAAEINAYPTLFQPYYRRIVAETDQGLKIGFYSVLNPTIIDWTDYPKNESHIVSQALLHPMAQIFSWFAQDRVYWRIEHGAEGESVLRGYDTRYGMQDRSLLGFWGIEIALNDTQSAPIGEFRQFRTSPSRSAQDWRVFWHRISGSGTILNDQQVRR